MSSAPVCGQNSAIPRPLQLSGSVKSGGLPCQLPLPPFSPKTSLGASAYPGLMLLPCLCLGGPFYPFLSLKHLLMFIEVKSTQWTPYGWHAIWHLHFAQRPAAPLYNTEFSWPQRTAMRWVPFTLSLVMPLVGSPSPHNTCSWPHHPCND